VPAPAALYHTNKFGQANIEILDLQSQTAEILSVAKIITAPNWMNDGTHLLTNRGPALYFRPEN